MFDLKIFSQDIGKFQNQKDFSKYLESYFMDLESYFLDLNVSDLNKIKFDFEELLYDLLDYKLVTNNNSEIINAFLILLSEQLEQANLIGAIKIIFEYLPESAVKYRLKASTLYLKINDLTTQYHNSFHNILELILESESHNGYRYRTVSSILNYYLTAMSQFTRVNNSNLAYSFKNLFLNNKLKYDILNDTLIADIIDKVTVSNYLNIIDSINTQISANKINTGSCTIDKDIFDISIELSNYSKKLYTINQVNFTKIKQVSFDYIKSIGDPSELHIRLNQGITIIDDEQLLYKYMVSYGAMHKAKLYESFETIIGNLNNIKINIIDWGCGQALATLLLLEYIKEHSLQIDIENITLIEPSKLALSRGLLHIDVTKQQNHKVKAINKDLDCIKQSDIEFNNNNIVLHLFSNILDVEFFKLDSIFLEKISKNIQSDNYFICVSPNINAKRNGRLDIFYKYFDENFNTELISTKDTNIGQHKRYEKVFEVKYITQEEVVEVRKEIKDYHVDIYVKLAKYATILEPTLSTQRLKENIEIDPDYVIFKIRKVAEIITSKIFMNNGGEDESRVSQNDKIRYLSFEKKILSRKAQSHLHTIRTIGNIGTHDHIENPAKMLKDDAYFLSTALILLIENLQENNII
ncbi:MAG: DUF4145 domain-containing protein [Sulfurimonas sp.]|nr:DUF4145 domain-containing protein [Sulfurimonas sp.]